MCDCLLWWNEKENEAERKRQSDRIDREIEDDSRKLKRECKILLLGSGESGKSTIVKQMRIIHKDGFPEEERKTYRETIYNNILDSAQAILTTIWKIGLIYPDEAVADQITNYRIDSSTGFVLTPEITQAIAQFWQEPIVAKFLNEHGNEFYLMDNAYYFLSEVTRIGSPDYIPTEVDILRARKKTTGISETQFSMGQLSILMIDVGGQRSERRKWIHHFESVTSILFCTALSEYDQVLLEDNTQNRMAESLILFESIINSRWFLRSSVILFLNKKDVFSRKLRKVPLERYFPEYTGGDEFSKAAKFILWKYMQANRARLSVYPHLTQATDTTNIRLVFAAVKETIILNALKDTKVRIL